LHLADAKRRNCHLGYQVVDADIEECDRLIQASVGTSGVAKRVGGVSWLAIYKINDIGAVKDVLNAFNRRQALDIGWRATAKINGTTKVAERIVATTIVRALSCLYTTLTTPRELDKLDQLLSEHYGLPPNRAIPLSDVSSIPRSGWCCVTGYPSEVPFCPVCERFEFKLEDGDGAVYSGSGICKVCRACIDIRAVQQLRC
jgi:hypothetical protein